MKVVHVTPKGIVCEVCPVCVTANITMCFCNCEIHRDMRLLYNSSFSLWMSDGTEKLKNKLGSVRCEEEMSQMDGRGVQVESLI